MRLKQKQNAKGSSQVTSGENAKGNNCQNFLEGTLRRNKNFSQTFGFRDIFDIKNSCKKKKKERKKKKKNLPENDLNVSKKLFTIREAF